MFKGLRERLDGWKEKADAEVSSVAVGESGRKIKEDKLEEILYELEKSPRPFVVMFVGVNGTGKTTTIAKLAFHIQKKGYTCVVAAADTFRAGAIEQLEKHAEAVGFRLIKHKAGA